MMCRFIKRALQGVSLFTPKLQHSILKKITDLDLLGLP